MEIDRFAPQYDVAERHLRDIRAPAEHVYAAVRSLELGRSPIIRALFRLRGMPEECLRIDGLLKSGFIFLAEVPNREVVFGLVGRFWKPSGELQALNAEGFRAFDQSGYAKAVWNFALEPLRPRLTRLTTETRVICLDPASRRAFRIYWLFVRPFSGLVRREVLRVVRQAAEESAGASQGE